MDIIVRHALSECSDPDCEIHCIEVALEEGVVTSGHLAYFIAGAKALLAAQADGRYSPQVRYDVLVHRLLVNAYGCNDCGAPAGDECYPEYGCDVLKDRVVERFVTA